MKKARLLALVLILIMALSACSSPADQTPSNNNDDTAPESTGAGSSENSSSNVTEDFLKTITPETATAKGACGPDLTWYYQDNVLVIKGTGEMTDYDKNWVTEAPWGGSREDELYKQINWVIIDEGVTSIGENAFCGLETLTKINIPNTMQIIGEYAFEDCSQLPKVEFPASVTYIGDGAFINCSEITEIVIPASVTYIGNEAFRETSLESITFLGNAPEVGSGSIAPWFGADTIFYSGSGFDSLIEKYPDMDWVKQ